MFRSPSDVEVIVYEKSVVGYVSYMNSRMYFDKDGIIVESTSETLPGVPKIAGLSFGHIVLHQPLPVEDISVFDEILNLTQVLSVNEVAVDEIRFNKEKEATLQIRSLKVELGSNSEMNGETFGAERICADSSGYRPEPSIWTATMNRIQIRCTGLIKTRKNRQNRAAAASIWKL